MILFCPYFLLFFNPDFPNNWNVMIKDDKSSKALIWDREKDTWLKKDTIGVVEDLMHTGYSILDEWMILYILL